MVQVKQFPWGSIFLLLGAYTAFGKFLTETADPSTSFWIAAIWAFILAIFFVHPLTNIGRFLNGRFQSDAVAFTSLVGLAAMASILLNWFKIFLPVFMLLACEALARIDLQSARYGERVSTVIMTITAWMGLASGWMIGQVL
ncbi:hypothetical protein ACN4EG_20255 [Alkalinema pantanalense CENA528]|uniref:hypothetical protein n=1 Tax=Alkalinema pantanalense TaxID=1620705 RepID=UPI003D6DE21F